MNLTRSIGRLDTDQVLSELTPALFTEWMALDEAETSEAWRQTAQICHVFYETLRHLLLSNGLEIPERDFDSFLPGAKPKETVAQPGTSESVMAQRYGAG